MPNFIQIDLNDNYGFDLRKKAAEYVKEYEIKRASEKGNTNEQSFGALAEIVVRNKLGMPDINPNDHPLGYDLCLSSGLKIDVKCRSGQFPFQEVYVGSDGIEREAKHNLFARQVNNNELDSDIYLFTHLQCPKVRELPGTKRQRKWNLFVCGWISKKRALNEGIYLPIGSITEQGNTWFPFRGFEIEFCHKNLNFLNKVTDLNDITIERVKMDELHKGSLNLTSADAVRITYDLIGRGVLTNVHLENILKTTGIENKIVKPILHPNQYFHLLNWLFFNSRITDSEIKKAETIIQPEKYEGFKR